jgi:hypothetical protein
MSHLHSSDNFRNLMQCDLHITEQEFTFSLISLTLSCDWWFPFSFLVYYITKGFVDQSLHSHCSENLKSQLISHCIMLMVIFYVMQLQCKNTCKWNGHRRLLRRQGPEHIFQLRRSLWGLLCNPNPPPWFRHSHFHCQAPPRPYDAIEPSSKRWNLWVRILAGNFA